MQAHERVEVSAAPAEPHAEQGGQGQMDMAMSKPQITSAQLAAVTLLTLLVLGGGVLIAALFGNFGMSARDMGNGNAVPGMAVADNTGPTPTVSMGSSGEAMPGMGGSKEPSPVSSLPQAQMSGVTRMNGLVMPPGMIMTQGMSATSMKDMAAVDLTKVSYTAPAGARGDQPLQPSVASDGAKVFNLDVSIIKWNILPGVQVAAYAFNRQIPGPRISITEGDHVRINVKNDLPEPTTVHWHGLVVPNQSDGPADVTQKPIEPGTT